MKVMLEVEVDSRAASALSFLANPDGTPLTWVIVDAKREMDAQEFRGYGGERAVEYSGGVRCELRLRSFMPLTRDPLPEDPLVEVGRAVERAAKEP